MFQTTIILQKCLAWRWWDMRALNTFIRYTVDTIDCIGNRCTHQLQLSLFCHQSIARLWLGLRHQI